MSKRSHMITSHEQLMSAIQNETQKFQEYYVWLEKAMPPSFFEEVDQESLMLITHSLMGFHLQEYFSNIHRKHAAIVLCLNSADADLRILKNYALNGIKNYETYVSNTPPPIPGIEAPLRIAMIHFTEAEEGREDPYPPEAKEELRALVMQRNPKVTEDEFNELIDGINSRFLRSLPIDRMILALDMFFRTKTRDNCQYEVRYNENWEDTATASMQIVLAWRNTPKHHFLYRLARTIHRHGLVIKRVNAAYVNPYKQQNTLLLALSLHGEKGEAVWDACDISEFLRELVTVKYFASFDMIDEILVRKCIISGNMANVLRAMVNFIHQALVNVDPNIYTLEHIAESLCKHPQLTVQLCEAFKWKFDRELHDLKKYKQVREQFLEDVSLLDTGNEENDTRRKNVLLQGMNLVHYTLKTNAYRTNFTAFCFRLDPKFLDEIPFDRCKKYPELPFAIYFMKGMHFFGFHIRFKDLARGGLRTIFPQQTEHLDAERNSIFAECYNLAYTQHKKNKDIPEGGAKGVIFLKPYERLTSESLILEKELRNANYEETEIKKRILAFQNEQRSEYLYQTQRSYIESLITIINCNPDGTLRAKHIIDYWKHPEYIYLGPDENMHDSMIQWIANFSMRYHYKPGSSFISGKPELGVNHKEYGVTSRGVNIYMDHLLRHLDIDPDNQPFTIKMTGGPDGDVAGNQICNLQRHYHDTAKLVALTDGSGTINDPEGLNLDILVELFKETKPIKHYPPKELHEGGFLLDKHARRSQSRLIQQTLCWRKVDGELIEDWVSGSEMNRLLHYNVHQTYADVFVPGGGRPRTLNEFNVKEFLDEKGNPTSKGIVEGANLYLNEAARKFLEKLGVLIIKDSSANKTGVICSSFEILCGLTLSDAEFIEQKKVLTNEILARLEICAHDEAELLLQSHKETGLPLTQISDKISERINLFTYQILKHLEHSVLSSDPNDPLMHSFLSYCLPTLRENFQADLLEEVPDHHKKAVIACHIGAQLVYRKGLNWFPSIVDILPILLQHRDIDV